jgi:UDP-N-acetylmuramoyl-tripeptide--D-alanyl-D-alanine ligase
MSEPLWNIEALVSATGGTLHGMPTNALNGVSIDSRSISVGDIFVAIKGENSDGHAYVPKALAAGAGLAIVNQATPDMLAAGPVLSVGRDPLLALEDMARAARLRSNARIIAVTGSVGKTSTKDMLRVALSASGTTHVSASSFNNHWGVPLSLARLLADARFAVFEIGMNHAGEITPLVGMVRPNIAIVTSVAASHLGHFASLEEIADAKAEIFTGLLTGGTALLPQDSAHFEQLRRIAAMRGVASVITFGKHASADIVIEELILKPDMSCITARLMGEKIIYKLGLAGEHMALNSLAALGAVKLVGADVALAALALAEAKPVKGRGVQEALVSGHGTILLIDESYNANPASVRAALKLLQGADATRRIAVLGDMLELGSFAEALHRGLAESCVDANVDQVFTSGPMMKHLWDELPPQRRGAWAPTSTELETTLLQSLKPGDAVMIKGSLGSKMAPLAEALRKRYAVRPRE